ncbi:YhgE/Pip domain-containing protein [Paenibacillus sp. HB172176]|uniref:YhgE/Pip domain-containing protein n=1 Tax=Paenibacillus sp. HB172176 TaxID=2493690 RepID=UPI00143C9C7E|nr:YhgE/Pip domain-containing protein [Paenibacillus sp. HB172176]
MKLNGVRQFGGELAAIGRNKTLLVSLIAILMVPVMYAGMFLAAFWDPYGQLNNLPVAVVNGDKGTPFQGEELHIGADFVEQLEKNEKFEWAFVSKEEAERGLKDDDYYIAIEIPSDFSERAATLTSEHPEQAQLVYMPNESRNFLASQIGHTAIEQIRTDLNKEVTEAYARAVFDKLSVASAGIGEASDGAGSVADGAAEAADGAQSLSEHAAQLADGAASLKAGAAQLDGAGARLADGAAGLSAAAGRLAGGAEQLAAAGGELNQGAAAAASAAARLESGLAASQAGADELAGSADALAAGLQALARSSAELADDPQVQALLAASKAVAAGAAQAAEGEASLHEGMSGLRQGLDSVTAGAVQLNDKLVAAESGAAELSSSLEQLLQGSSELSQGMSGLRASSGELASGAEALSGGADSLASSMLQLQDGSAELSSKLQGATEEAGQLSANDETLDMFADPIRLDEQAITTVTNYGTGFAPYFLSLGLYVGALLLTIVYAVKEPAIRPANGWSWFWSKALTLLLIGVLQALIADTVLLTVIHLEVQNLSVFFLYSIVTSMTYMMIIQFLVASMGNPGRFIATMLLILQLTSAAGTFPAELIPGWLQQVSRFVPMTYSVAGFRDIISSGDISRAWSDAGMLAIYAAVFALLSLTYFIRIHNRESRSSGGGQATIGV